MSRLRSTLAFARSDKYKTRPILVSVYKDKDFFSGLMDREYSDLLAAVRRAGPQQRPGLRRDARQAPGGRARASAGKAGAGGGPAPDRLKGRYSNASIPTSQRRLSRQMCLKRESPRRLTNTSSPSSM